MSSGNLRSWDGALAPSPTAWYALGMDPMPKYLTTARAVLVVIERLGYRVDVTAEEHRARALGAERNRKPD